MAATVRTARQLAAAGEAPDGTLPGEVLRFFDFLSTAEKDLRFLMDLCTEHMAALEKQPLVLRRVDSVLEGAQKAFIQVDSVLDGGLDKIRRTKMRRERAGRKFAESAEFRSQEPVVARHHAAILRELVHLRQISLQSPTPSQTTITTTTGTTTTTTVEEEENTWSSDNGGSLTKFDNIALLADLMGDTKLSNSTPSPPPKYPFQPVTSSTFPLAELGGNTRHRTDSRLSCPPSELSSVAYGTGTELEPAELPADYQFTLPPELPPKTKHVYRTHRASTSCVTLAQTQTSPDHENSTNASSLPPPEKPEERTRPRSVSQGDPAPPPVPPKVPLGGIYDPHDHEAQPFSPLSDLRPFVQPPPVVEEKQVVVADDQQRVSDRYYLEEKEVIVRQSVRKKSNPRLLLNQADNAGLSLLLGDERSYGSRYHAAQSSSAVSLISNTESQQTETYPECPTTEPPKPPSPPFARQQQQHTVRSEPSIATISSVSGFSDVFSDVSADSTQESASTTASTSSRTTTMGPVQPLSTIPPELLYGHAANFHQQAAAAARSRAHSIPRKAVQARPAVPSIVVQEPTPVDKSSGLRDLFG